MTTAAAQEPYGSASDLPSIQEMETQIVAFKLLGFLLSREQRQQLAKLQDEVRRITTLVDAFYELLGARNWIFTGDLNLTALEHVVGTDDPAVAESRLVEYYRDADRVRFGLQRLWRFEAMRPRIPLLEKALRDYLEERYYSTILVLLAVMDGFVNDFEKESRQGLHTRSAEDMVPWDSVAGHHLGLGHAHASFVKSFRKTDESEVTELYRHGIMHGVLVNYDNVVVATKAWNRLFAVTDWADARIRQAKPVEPQPGLRESLARWRAVKERRKTIDAWSPYVCSIDPGVTPQCEVASACQDFLRRWAVGQWGLLGAHFMQVAKEPESPGRLAQLAKDLYGTHALTEWSTLQVRHTAAGVAVVDVVLTVDDRTGRAEMRWVTTGTDGSVACEWEPGRWGLGPYGLPALLDDEAAT